MGAAASGDPASLVKSKQRVADHGEVFTPAWLVEDMLDLVGDEAERIDSRFLELACGLGKFLVPILGRKLAAVHAKYCASDFEKRHHALFALMCIYGIEFLADNVTECRQNLLDCLFEYLGSSVGDEWNSAARVVAETNIVHGDARDMPTASGDAVTFPEWACMGRASSSGVMHGSYDDQLPTAECSEAQCCVFPQRHDERSSRRHPGRPQRFALSGSALWTRKA